MNNNKKLWVVAIAGFLIGALTLVTVRFATYKPEPVVHYHANLALYINGQRDEFKGPGFYEEVQSCGSDMVDNPKTRVHLHDNTAHVVHVHANAVTWGHLFANFGYGLTNESVVTDSGVYVDGQNGVELHFMLNGEEVESIANRLIGNEDYLVVSVGSINTDELRDLPAKDAHDYNLKNDPASCTGTKKATYWDRMKDALGF